MTYLLRGEGSGPEGGKKKRLNRVLKWFSILKKPQNTEQLADGREEIQGGGGRGGRQK